MSNMCLKGCTVSSLKKQIPVDQKVRQGFLSNPLFLPYFSSLQLC